MGALFWPSSVPYRLPHVKENDLLFLIFHKCPVKKSNPVFPSLTCLDLVGKNLYHQLLMPEGECADTVIVCVPDLIVSF